MESRAKSVMFLGREIHNFDTHTWQRTTGKQQKKEQRFAQSCRAEWIKFEGKKKAENKWIDKDKPGKHQTREV